MAQRGRATGRGGSARPVQRRAEAVREEAAALEDASLYIGHARAHFARGELGEAQAAYELALRFDARSLEALCGLAQVLLRRNVVDQARRVIGQAMQIDAAHPHAHKLLAELHLKVGRFDQAARHFQLASEHDAERRRYRR